MRIYHNFVFWVHNVKILFKLSILGLGILFIFQILLTLGLLDFFVLDKYDWMVLFKFIEAAIISNITPEYSILFTNPDGTSIVTTAQVLCQNEGIRQVATWVFDQTQVFLLKTSLIYGLYPMGLVLLIMVKAPRKKKDHVRGAQLSSAKEFSKAVIKQDDTMQIPIGNIWMPKSCTAKSTLIVGKPGVGKTVQISEIFCHLRTVGTRMVIYDFKGDYIERFYDPSKDIIFNPFDERGIDWNLFSEISGHLDIDAVGASLIPSLGGTSADPFWQDGARDLFCSILIFLFRNDLKSNGEIWAMISSDGKTIRDSLKRCPGAEKGLKYIVDHGSKMAISILAVLAQYGKCFEHMEDGSNEFSITNWIESGTGNIFISNNASVQDSLKPILSLFLDLVIRKTLSMPDNTMVRTVFLLDEFTSLQKLPSMIKLLTLGRSKRASAFLGTQSYSQIEGLYGKPFKESIINSCGNQILFSVAGAQSAKEASAILGDYESIKPEQSVSTGSDYREGASLAYRMSTESLVLPSEIMGLTDLEFIAKFSGYSPIKSKLKYSDHPKSNDGFLMRPDLLFTKDDIMKPMSRIRKKPR